MRQSPNSFCGMRAAECHSALRLGWEEYQQSGCIDRLYAFCKQGLGLFEEETEHQAQDH